MHRKFPTLTFARWRRRATACVSAPAVVSARLFDNKVRAGFVELRLEIKSAAWRWEKKKETFIIGGFCWLFVLILTECCSNAYSKC